MYEELIKQLRDMSIPCDGWKDLYAQAADAIEELLRKEKFHAFLWNVINPNDMQLYLEMYHSSGEKEET